MNIFDNLKKTFGANKAPGVAALEKAEGEAMAALETARAQVETLRDALPAALIAGDAARQKARAELRAAEDDATDAASALEIVKARLAQARAEADEATRRAAYLAAQKGRDEAAARLREQYPRLVSELRALIEDIAHADAQVVEVNGALPSGAAPLERVEEVTRDIAGEPRRVLSEKVVQLWCPAGTARPVPNQGNIHDHGGGRGQRHMLAGGGGAYVQHFDRRQFREVKVSPGRNAMFASRLHALDLPGLRGDEAPAWTPMPVDSSPALILARLDALDRDADAQEPEPERIEVVHELIVHHAQAAE